MPITNNLDWENHPVCPEAINVSEQGMRMCNISHREFPCKPLSVYIPHCGMYVHHCGTYIHHCGTYIPQCGI